MRASGSEQGQQLLRAHLRLAETWLAFATAAAISRKVTGLKLYRIIYGHDIMLSCRDQGQGRQCVSVFSPLVANGWYFLHAIVICLEDLLICVMLFHM